MKKRILSSIAVLVYGLVLLFAGNPAEKQTGSIAAVCGNEEAATEEVFADYIGDDIVVPVLDEDTIQTYATPTQQPGEAAARAAGASYALPESYDSRQYGYVTEAKTQIDNTCWTYSAVSTAETSILSSGESVDGNLPDAESFDLSEAHLAYAFYHMPVDEMGNTDGDATTALGSYTGVGGNHVFTTFGLADWYGIASEQTVRDVTEEQWEDETVAIDEYPDSVHLQQAYWINLAADQKNVKRMILTHGSVAVSMWYGSSCYNSRNSAYYCDLYDNPTAKTKRVNHAVQIVGWDDTYSRTNFNSDPGTDGAWLAKNSMGTGWGDDGYFWISYADHALTQSSAKAFVFAFERADNYAHIYQYDGSAGAYINSTTNSTGYQVESGGSIANVFRVPADCPTGFETLDAVSFALYAVSTDYSIQIYKNPTDAGNPASGEPLLTQPVTGRTSFVGYYTIPLSEKPLLQAGDTFSVVVTLSKSSGKAIAYFADISYQNGGWIRFTNQVQEGQSFACVNGSWSDLAASGATARVKAFTNDYQIPASSITITAETDQLWKGDTLALLPVITPENAGRNKLAWTSSDPEVATVDTAGVVHGKKSGTATITAALMDGSGLSASYQVTVQTPAEKVTIRDSRRHLSCEPGKSIQLELQISPTDAAADSIYFTSSDEKIAVIDADGRLTGKHEGTVTITVYSRYQDKKLLSIEVSVKQKTPDTEKETETETEKKHEDTNGGDSGQEEPGSQDTEHPAAEADDTEAEAAGQNGITPVREAEGDTAPLRKSSGGVRTGDETQPEAWVLLGLIMAVILADLAREKKGLS